MNFYADREWQGVYWRYETRALALNWDIKTWWPIYQSIYYDGNHNTIHVGPLQFYWWQF